MVSFAQNRCCRCPDAEAGQVRVCFFLLLPFLSTLPVDGAFTHPAQWKLDEIEQTHAGTWCYRPGSSPAHTRQCANNTLSALLEAHISNDHGAGLSIAFYDLEDLSVFGGASWANWDDVALPVGVCTSGRVDGLDDTYSTTCRFAVADNDHATPSAHAEECIINRPQLRVTDGCYTLPPRRPWFRLDDSTSSILAIVGLIISLPLVATVRWYRRRRAQQKVVTSSVQALPLVDLRGDAVDRRASQDISHPESQTGQCTNHRLYETSLHLV